MSSSYRFNRLCLSHWDPYAVCRGSCLEFYYCNMVEWFWWDSNLISTTNWFSSVLWHCRFGHLACKNRPRNDLLCVEWDLKPLHYHYHHLSVCLSIYRIVWKVFKRFSWNFVGSCTTVMRRTYLISTLILLTVVDWQPFLIPVTIHCILSSTFTRCQLQYAYCACAPYEICRRQYHLAKVCENK